MWPQSWPRMWRARKSWPMRTSSTWSLPRMIDQPRTQDSVLPCAIFPALLCQDKATSPWNRANRTDLLYRFQKFVTVKQPMFSRNRAPEMTEETLPCLIAHADHRSRSHAILDTGASRCVIGSKNLDHLVGQLPETVQNQIKSMPSSVRFRFGNNQSLTSEKRVLCFRWCQPWTASDFG